MTNGILVRRDLAISPVAGKVPQETLRNLRSSPLLGDLMFHVSADDLKSLKEHRNEHYMFQVLKQAAQLKQSQPQEFRILNQNLGAPFKALP